jgi:hypothetical protein
MRAGWISKQCDCREGCWLMSIYFAEVDALALSTAAMMEVDE